MRGIYIHVPFCVRKCSYCDFYSVPASLRWRREYPGLLAREMDLLLARFPEEAAAGTDTVYFGGGTPTVLGPETLRGLLSAVRERFSIAAGAEVTTEANPGTVSPGDLTALREGGFNRISVGAQSFSAGTLRTLGRIHGKEEIRRTIRDARSAGFPSVGVDLIFGVPGQTPASWREDLERALALSPSHVSAYALAPEPGTPIHTAIGRGELRMPSDDEVAELYEETGTLLPAAGLSRYEISNFALPGQECRHNLKYWRRDPYLGFGPSAHGLLFPRDGAPHGLRTENPSSLAEYETSVRKGHPPWSETCALTLENAWKESLIFGLRMADGVDLREIEKRIGAPPESLRGAVDALVASGMLRSEGDRLRLPDRLFFVSNEVFARLA
ncbi:MAG TPA: radical SAM family heme chaperone HemW [Candidatus Deferrimicrobiaceae bacterium]